MKYIHILIIIIALGIFGFFFTYPQYQLKTSLDKSIDFLNLSIENNQKYIKSLEELDNRLSKEPGLKKIDVIIPLEEPISEIFRFFEKQAENNGVVISNINFSVEEQSDPFFSGEFYSDGQASSLTSEAMSNGGQAGIMPEATGSGNQPPSEEIVFSQPSFTEFSNFEQGNISRIISRDFKLEEINITFKVNGSYNAIKNFIISLENSIRLIKIEDFNLKKADVNGKNKETDLLEVTIGLKVHNYTKIIK